MEAIIFTPFADEVNILAAILQQLGGTTRQAHKLDEISDQASLKPGDVYLLAIEDIGEKTRQLIRRLSGTTVSPIILILDSQRESVILDFYQSGADMIITRPYSPRLLAAQMRALLRWSGVMPTSDLAAMVFDSIRLDPMHHELRIKDRPPIHLTGLEFRLLHYLMMHPGQTLSAENIIETVWGYSGEGNRELLRGLIQRLRMKMEDDPHDPVYIVTEPGIGYLFIPIPSME